MSKPTKFIPHYVRHSKKWILNLPGNVSRTGKRRRLTFRTREAALKSAEKFKARLKKFGSSLSNLDPVRLGEAHEAFTLIDLHVAKTKDSCTLISVVRGYISQYQERHKSVTLSSLFDQFLQAKANRNPRYLEQLKHCQDKFDKLDVKVSDLHHSHLLPILDSFARGTRNNYIRYLRVVLNFGIKKGYLKDNPALKIDLVTVAKREVETFPNEVIRGLLEKSLERKSELVPFFVLTAFMGVRPEGEVYKVLWKDVDWERKELIIRAEVSKTHRRRFVPIPDCAFAWLNRYREEKSKAALLPDKPVVKLGRNVLALARKKIFRLVSPKGVWPTSVLRHCYASNRLAVSNDIDRLTIELGHTRPTMLFEHYHAHTRLEDAQAYFSIMPPN